MNHQDYYSLSRYTTSDVQLAAAGWTLIARSNPNRVSLIAFNSDLAGVQVVYALSQSILDSNSGITVGGANSLDLHFPVHGPLVCQEWYARNAFGVGVPLMVIEQVMDKQSDCYESSTSPYPTLRDDEELRYEREKHQLQWPVPEK